MGGINDYSGDIRDEYQSSLGGDAADTALSATGAAIGGAGTGAAVGSAIGGGAAAGSSGGPVGAGVGALVGALIAAGTVIAMKAKQHKVERTGVAGQNRVNKAYYNYNKQTQGMEDRYNANVMENAKKQFEFNKGIQQKRMNMAQQNMLDKQQRQDAAIKNSIFQAQRTAPAERIARADRNILKMEM